MEGSRYCNVVFLAGFRRGGGVGVGEGGRGMVFGSGVRITCHMNPVFCHQIC